MADPNGTFITDRTDVWEYGLYADNRADTEGNSKVGKYLLSTDTCEVGIILFSV